MSDAPTIRYDFLDWLRVIAIGVLFFFHTGMLFVGWGFHLQNAEVMEGLQLPMDLAHRLRMPLLFVIAGASLWYASRRYTAGHVVKERLWRLGIPVVFGMLVIVPPQIYLERLFNGQWDAGYFQFYVQRVLEFKPYPEGNFSWHHLWFIVYLLVYVPLLLPFVDYAKHARWVPKPGAWFVLLALPLALNEALLKPWFPESHALINDWYVFNHYLLLTLYGVLLARIPGAWDWLARHRKAWLATMIVVTAVGLGLLEGGIVQRNTPWDALIANVFTWTCLLTFLSFGRYFLSRENGFLRWAREASYPFYILHQTVLLIIAYGVIAQPWSPGIKFWVVLIGTFAGCFVLYEALVRRSKLARWLFGMKPNAPARMPPASTVLAASRLPQ